MDLFTDRRSLLNVFAETIGYHRVMTSSHFSNEIMILSDSFRPFLFQDQIINALRFLDFEASDSDDLSDGSLIVSYVIFNNKNTMNELNALIEQSMQRHEKSLSDDETDNENDFVENDTEDEEYDDVMYY